MPCCAASSFDTSRGLLPSLVVPSNTSRHAVVVKHASLTLLDTIMQNHVAGARRPSSAPSSPQRTIAVPAPAQRVAAALAPAGSQPQPKPESSLLKPQPRSLRGTLSGLFNRWDSRAPPESVQALVEATSVAQQQVSVARMTGASHTVFSV